MKIIGIIPARYGSQRLLGKPLIVINQKPLIQLTYEAVLHSNLFDSIFIATESKKIKSVVEKFGATCILTSQKNRNGTERCAELIQTLKLDNSDLIINIQCDEPFLQTKHLKKIINLFNSSVKIGTLISPILESEILDESVVKVKLNKQYTAINFNRIVSNEEETHALYKHIGIYGYRKNILLEISKLITTKRELTEKLEQLRWVEHGYTITCAWIDENIKSINTKNDIKNL